MRDLAKWRVLGLVAVGTFMTTLDSSIVNISLPAIARGFGTPLSGAIEWVVIVYLVAIAALLLTFGRLSDIVGRKSITLVGLVIFTIGSALCGLAPSLGVLIAARAFQGVGGALIFAPSVALLTDAFPPEERGRAIGLNAVGVAAVFLAQVDAQSAPVDLVWRLALVGLGIGLFQSPNNRALMAAAPKDEQGEASGVLGTGRVVGQSLSVALAGAIFAAFGGTVANAQLAQRETLSPEQVTALQQTFVAAFHAALLVSAAIAGVGIVTSLVRGKADQPTMQA